MRSTVIRYKVFPFLRKFLKGSPVCGTVFLPVSRSFKPEACFFIKPVYMIESTCREEIRLHILHHILYLPFRLRIGLMTEHGMEMLLFYKCLELPGQYQVPHVCPCYKDFILVINDLLRPTSEIFECKFMGINRKSGIKRPPAEIDEFIS